MNVTLVLIDRGLREHKFIKDSSKAVVVLKIDKRVESLFVTSKPSLVMTLFLHCIYCSIFIQNVRDRCYGLLR